MINMKMLKKQIICLMMGAITLITGSCNISRLNLDSKKTNNADKVLEELRNNNNKREIFENYYYNILQMDSTVNYDTFYNVFLSCLNKESTKEISYSYENESSDKAILKYCYPTSDEYEKTIEDLGNTLQIPRYELISFIDNITLNDEKVWLENLFLKKALQLSNFDNETFIGFIKMVKNEYQEKLKLQKLNKVMSYTNLSYDELIKFANDIIANEKQWDGEYDNVEAVIDLLYEVSLIPIEDKMEAICQRENLTYDDLDIMIGCCVREAERHGHSYFGGYSVINTLFNRKNDSRWNPDDKKDMWSLLIAPGQYGVYADGAYEMFLYENIGKNNVGEFGYKGAVDMLYTGVSLHSFCSYVSNSSPSLNNVKYAADGNQFYYKVTKSSFIYRATETFSINRPFYDTSGKEIKKINLVDNDMNKKILKRN